MPPGQLPHGYGSLYMNIAMYPELGLFRRFGAYWAKKLHDDTSDVLTRLGDVNRAIAGVPGLGESSVLDCPLRVVKEKCPENEPRFKNLYTTWKKYDEALLRYGQTLCISEQVMKLPQQSAHYTEHLAEFKPPSFKAIFENDKFVPTGEKARTYQESSVRSDTCAWSDIPQSDALTMCYIHSSKWIERNVLSRLRRRSNTTTPVVPRIQTDVRHGRVVGVIDTLTCLFASLLLEAAVQGLTWVRPLKVRVGLIGAFGTIFALSVKLMAGNITRGEVFGATAAFYAVAVVFVGSTTNDCACR